METEIKIDVWDRHGDNHFFGDYAISEHGQANGYRRYDLSYNGNYVRTYATLNAAKRGARVEEDKR